MNSIPELVQRLLADPQVGWGLGRVGALAEFCRAEDEPCQTADGAIRTERGALRFSPDAKLRIYAGEGLGHCEASWSQWLAFALPVDDARLAGRETIAELGPDAEAPDAADRAAIRFDLGIGGPCFELCVRTADPALQGALRSARGRRLLDDDALVHRLAAASPDRVFCSRLARIEVRQPIAAPDGRSPEGPHTHLLPQFLADSALVDDTAPAGWSAQCCAYPPSPVRDALGRPKAFEATQHAFFQALVQQFGDPAHVAAKQEVANALAAGLGPEAMELESDARRIAARIALRQLRCTRGDSRLLRTWSEALGA